MRLLSLFLLMTVSLFAADPESQRKEAEQLATDGNWREAYELRLKLLDSIDDEKSGQDLQQALSALSQLGEQEKFDPLLTELTGKKATNPDFMLSAGQAYLQANHYGFIIDNEFQRGQNSRASGGTWQQVEEQDRLRSLQCYLQAWKIAGKASKHEVEALNGLAAALTHNRLHSNNLWQFYLLTDLDSTPDYTEGIDHITSDGAPANSAGDPTFLALPDTWENAKSDGERWRWLLQEISHLKPSYASTLDFAWHSFCENNYDVGTLSTYSWWSQPEVQERDGILQASSLQENETIARLANGVKRFTLPDDYQFIAGYRTLLEAKGSPYSDTAGDRLVQVFLNRNQLVAARKTLQQVIKLHGKGHDNSRAKLLKQIQGNWSQFGHLPTAFAGEPVTVPFTFRNATEVTLTLNAVKDEKIIQDIFAHLESNPEQINYNTTNFSNLGNRLLEKDGEKYLAETVREWTQELKPAEAHRDTVTDLDLGKLAPGCYLLKSELKNGNTSWIAIWVRDLVLMQRTEGKAETFYLVEASDGSPVAGEVEFFCYRTKYLEKPKGKRRFEILTKNFRQKTDENGKLELKDKPDLEGYNWFAIVRSGDRHTLLSNRSFYWRDTQDYTDFRAQKTIGITDRPVYRPGQTVHFKLWAGESRYDLADVSTYAGKSATVEIKDARGESILKKEDLIADEFGGITFDHELPEEAALGNYTVSVTGKIPYATFSFRVEEYKKPEYEVKVEAPTAPVTLGEDFEATVSAHYYHGAPVTEATVKITVERDFFTNRWFPAADWDWLYGPGYWWFYSEYPWYPGWGVWGCVRPSPPWWQHSRMGAPELVLEQTSPIGPDGKVKVKIDSSIAKLVHGDQDHKYTITTEVVDSSRRTIVGSGSVIAARKPFSVTVWTNRGHATVGEKVTGTFAARTLDGKKVAGTATSILYRTLVADSGEITEEEVERWSPESDHWTFTASQPGQYRVAVEFTDEKGNKQEGASIFTIRGAGNKGNFRYNDLELIPDKKEYHPGDTVKLLVNINQPDSRVWLFIRPTQGELQETRIIQIEGKSQLVEIPVTLRDTPNFFIEGVTIAKGQIHTVTREIVLPPEKRKLTVDVLPEKDKLKPREETSLTIRITDSEGKPYQGSAAISIYDKSLEYISGGSNIGEIVPFFWDWKRHFRSTGMASSQNLSGSHMQKPDTTSMRQLGLFGNMITGRMGNTALYKTAAPMARAAAMPAPMMDAVAEMEFGEADLFEAGGGDAAENTPEVLVRSEFADLLKWVGTINTDENGEAKIPLEMPDNLTTWVIKTWAMGHGTRVGEGSAEIVTSKDLIVRLQAPRFFVEKDETTLSAIVHNYHEQAKDVTVSLELDGKSLAASGPTERRVVIPSQGETRLDWTTKALREGQVTIRMKAITEDDSDAMEMTFPVYVHGFAKTESFSRSIAPEENSAKIEFTLPEDRRPSETRLTINYSPSIATAMVDALPYLTSSPYDSTEVTLNRFLSASVTHHLLTDLGYDLAAIRDKTSNLNPQQLGDPKDRAALDHRSKNPVWDEAEIHKLERKGIAKLQDQQNPDGGWGWFSAFGHQSYPHTTAIVMHGLLLARDNGLQIPVEMIDRGLAWLEKHEKNEADRIENWEKRGKNTKPKADSIDAFVRRVLGEGGIDHQPMTDFLYRDKNDLPVYAKALLGLELHRIDQHAKRDEVIRNIRQFLQHDEENQTAYLNLPNRGYWWFWYGSEYEAHAWFLKLLTAAEPDGADARGLVKYLINNRRNAYYWNSTRDTAYCVEAIGEYLTTTREGSSNLTIEVLLDGKTLKTVEITQENLFTFDSSAIVAGDILTTGKHEIEIRKTGTGPLYTNAYIEYFTLEDFITSAGLEIKVDRTYYKLVPETKTIDAVDSDGRAIDQKRAKYKRIPLESGDTLKSGDLIEVELGIDSKNDYEYLVFEDWKAAGTEAVEVRSGYNPTGLGAYMELRDEKVALFVQNLPRGRHNLSYRLRAEIPGKFSALPTRATAIYAPELRANSNEIKLQITD